VGPSFADLPHGNCKVSDTHSKQERRTLAVKRTAATLNAVAAFQLL
jgi:hypothetical protein